MTTTAAWNPVPPGSYAQPQTGMGSCLCPYCVQACGCAECASGYSQYCERAQSAAQLPFAAFPPTHTTAAAAAAAAASTSGSSPSSGVQSGASWSSPQFFQPPQLQQRSPAPFAASRSLPQAADPASSDEALSPPHQEDPIDDVMDVKEASRLQHEIVKAWKQKKRTTCEMKTRTQDKYRQVYSSHQRFELEKEYHFQKYISSARKAELSRTLHLSERQIKIWFQNRRAKERRQRKNQQKSEPCSSVSERQRRDEVKLEG